MLLRPRTSPLRFFPFHPLAYRFCVGLMTSCFSRSSDASIEIVPAIVVLDLQDQRIPAFLERQRDTVLIRRGDADGKEAMDLLSVQEDLRAVIAPQQERHRPARGE